MESAARDRALGASSISSSDRYSISLRTLVVIMYVSTRLRHKERENKMKCKSCRKLIGFTNAPGTEVFAVNIDDNTPHSCSAWTNGKVSSWICLGLPD